MTAQPEVISPWPAVPVPGVADWHALPNTEGCYEFSVYIDGDTRPLGWVRSWLRPGEALRSEPRVMRPTLRTGYRAYTFRQGDSKRYRWAHQLCLEVYEGPRPPAAAARRLDGSRLGNQPRSLR